MTAPTPEWQHPMEVEWVANGREQILSALRDPNTVHEVLRILDEENLVDHTVEEVLQAAADLLTPKDPA